MDVDDLLWVCAAIVSMAAAGGVVWGVLRWVFRGMRRVGRFLDEWNGTEERPGAPAVPGVPARLDIMDSRLEKIDTRVAAVEAQMSPNSGSTLRDAVDRIEVNFSSGDLM